MKSKIYNLGRVKRYKYHLPIVYFQFMICGLELPNQWCLGYKRIRIFFMEIMWHSPISKIN